jgi:N6-adenosine-specific RNA methylase IME4
MISAIWKDLSPPYATIVADPPWRYRKSRQELGTVHSRAMVSDLYATLSMRELATLPVSELASDNAHLYLWVTVPRLFGERDDKDGFGPFHIMQAWGFRYVTMLTWHKTGAPGMGSYFRIDTEHCLFGVRGHAPIPPTKRLRNVIAAPRGRHSEKPFRLLEIAEEVSPSPRLELFARSRRSGWDAWGLEAPSLHETIPIRLKATDLLPE